MFTTHPTTTRHRLPRQAAILLILALISGGTWFDGGAAVAAPQSTQELSAPAARLGAWVSPQGDRSEIHHGATMLDGQLWTITSTGAIAWDVSDPMEPTATMSVQEPGTGEYGAIDHAVGGGGVVAVAAWTRNIELPGIGYGVQNRPEAEACDDTTCELTLIEDGEIVATVPFTGSNLTCLGTDHPGRGHGRGGIHGSAGRSEGASGQATDDCAWLWTSSGQVFQRTDDGLILREERWHDSLDTDEHLGEVREAIRVAPGVVAMATVGSTSVVVADTSDPVAPSRLRTVELGQVHGMAIDNLAGVPGTTEAFAGARGQRNAITSEQRSYCNGISWFDWQTGDSTSWGIDAPPTSTGAYPQVCWAKVSPHPDFEHNRLIAAAIGRAGVALVHVSETGGFTLLDRRLIPRGFALDVAWTSDDTLAAAAYDGGLVVTRVSMG